MKIKLFSISILTILALNSGFVVLAGASPLPDLRLPDTSVTMIVVDGNVSYFDISLCGIPSLLDVTNGSYMGWCADRSVVMPRNEKLTVRLYNSYDSLMPVSYREKNWGKVNYILNHKCGAAKNDIQDAFWYLLCDYTSITSTAQLLVDTAQDEFVPQPGDLIAILGEPIQNNSNPWPFQFVFLQVILPPQEPSEPENPTEPVTYHSHGFHYNDVAPIANANGPYSGISSQVIDFNGSASYDPDGLLIRYKWSFGDGTTVEGITATHFYTHPGIYRIILTVTDNFGISNEDMTNATIIEQNRPPTNLIIGGTSVGIKNMEYTYVFGALDEDHDPLSYKIDWGDGVTNQTDFLPSGHYFNLLHQWSSAGSFTVTMMVSDGTLYSESEKDVIIHETPVAYNIYIIGLALIILIVLLVIFLYTKMNNKK
jgi:hypothetical protein